MVGAFKRKHGFDEDFVRRIAQKTLTIEERKKAERIGNIEEGISPKEASRQWESFFTGGDTESSKELREWLTIDQIREVTESGCRVDTDMLNRMGGVYSSMLGQTEAEISIDIINDEYPFEGAYIPLIESCYSELIERVRDHITNSIDNDINKGALEDMAAGLLRRVTMIGKRPLYSLFKKGRSHGEEFILSTIESYENAPTDRYDEFIKDLRKGEWRQVFKQYPVLLRLISAEVYDWLDASTDFLRRYVEDKDQITSELIDSARGDIKLEGIEYKGDSHPGGRVCILDLGVGRVVYKPRVFGSKKVLKRIYRCCDDQLSGGLQFPDSLERNNYKWSEYITQEECSSLSEVKDYFTRSGYLLSLLYILGSVDIHHENIIAHGSYPVLVDYETIMHGDMTDGNDRYAYMNQRIYENYNSSVVETGFLPDWIQQDSSRDLVEVGGLSGLRSQPTVKRDKYCALNTDLMHVCSSQKQIKRENIVYLKGDAEPAHEWTSQIKKGFRTCLSAIIENKESILEKVTNELNNNCFRFIYRPTRVYRQIISKSLSPDNLTSGVKMSLSLYDIFIPYLNNTTTYTLPIYKSELSDLKNNKIPIFHVNNNSTDIRHGDKIFSDVLDVSPKDKFLLRISDLNSEQIQLQSKIIDNVLFARKISTKNNHKNSYSRLSSNKNPSHSFDVKDEANRLGKQILNRSITNNGGRYWIDINPNIENVSRFSYGPVGIDIYRGVTGIALFFSALQLFDDKPSYKHVVYDLLNPICQDINHMVQNNVRSNNIFGVGGLVSIGSLIYAFKSVSNLMLENKYLNTATKLVRAISPEQIHQDRRLDLLTGTAGTLRSILSLHRVREESMFIDVAELCADHLVELQTRTPSSGCAWSTTGNKPLLGMAHGASGIALSLADAHKVTANPRYRKAVDRALSFIINNYAAPVCNWPDYRNHEREAGSVAEDKFQSRWCVGSPGIIRSLAELKYEYGFSFSDKYIVQPLIRLQHINEDSTLDHICCGSMGRYIVISALTNYLDDKYFSKGDNINPLESAKKLASKRKRNGGYKLFEGQNVEYEPVTFMQGLSGIGYALLYLSNIKGIPDITIME